MVCQKSFHQSLEENSQLSILANAKTVEEVEAIFIGVIHREEYVRNVAFKIAGRARMFVGKDTIKYADLYFNYGDSVLRDTVLAKNEAYWSSQTEMLLIDGKTLLRK